MPQKLAASPNEARSGNGDEPDTSSESETLAIVSSESETLAIVSIESEDSGSGETIAHIRLGGMSSRADDANSPGRRTEMLKGQVDESEGRTDESRARVDTSNTSNEAKTVVVSHRTEPDTYLGIRDENRTVDETDGPESHTDASSCHRDALNASNGAVMGSMSCRDSAETYLGAADAKCAVDETECARSYADMSTGHRDALSVKMDAPNVPNHAGTTGISHGDEPNTYLGAGGAKRGVDAADGIESHTDASSGHRDAQSVQTDAITTVNAPEILSTHPIEPETPNLPGEGARWTPDQPNGVGDHTNGSSMHTDVQSVQTDAIKPTNTPVIVRTSRNPHNPLPPLPAQPVPETGQEHDRRSSGL